MRGRKTREDAECTREKKRAEVGRETQKDAEARGRGKSAEIGW